MTKKARRVLVTGSSRGIGRAIALELARNGYEIVVHYKSNRDQADSAAEEIVSNNGAATILQFDVSQRDECRVKLENDIAQNGAFYGVVLSAGIHRDAPFPGLSDVDWDSVIGTNLHGFYNVLSPLVMPMIQLRDGGRIIALSSLAGLTGHRGQVNYSASKAGIIGASKSLAQELAKRSITVNCIAPGFIETEMLSNYPLEELVQQIPMRRLGTVSEVASLASYLFSPGASYVTGQVISINGGML